MPKFDIAGRYKFTGGTIIALKFEQPIRIEQIRNSLRAYGLEGSTIQPITLTRYMLKLMIASKIFTSPSAYGADGFLLFDPNYGRETKRKAVKDNAQV